MCAEKKISICRSGCVCDGDYIHIYVLYNTFIVFDCEPLAVLYVTILSLLQLCPSSSAAFIFVQYLFILILNYTYNIVATQDGNQHAMNYQHHVLSRVHWLRGLRRLLQQGTNLPYLIHDSINCLVVIKQLSITITCLICFLSFRVILIFQACSHWKSLA